MEKIFLFRTDALKLPFVFVSGYLPSLLLFSASLFWLCAKSK